MTAATFQSTYLNSTVPATYLPSTTRYAVADAHAHLVRLLVAGEPIASAMGECRRTPRHVKALAQASSDPSYSSVATDFWAISGP